MDKKRTLQNNLSYALKYMFDNYGINIFLDSQKFIVTLKNLIPNLDEEIKLVEHAIEKNAVSAIVSAYDKRDIDKNFAYLRAKTILTKNGISEKAALYIVDCFSYALNWIDEIPDYENLSDLDFKITKKSEEEPKKSLYIKKIEDNNLKSDSKIKLDKKNNSEEKKDDNLKPLHFEEKTLSSSKKEPEEDKKIETENKKIEKNKVEKKEIIEKEDDDKMSKKDSKPEVKSNSKYYLNHDFDDEYDDDYDYDDDDEEYESSSIFKKIALILIPILIIGALGFFIFKNFNKEADPVLSGVSITTEYKIENGNYILPINQETHLNVIIQSKNSKKIDLSKLSFKIENPSICSFTNDGKKCTITGLKEGNTKLVVIYNNEIVDSIALYFEDFVAEEEQTKPDTQEEQVDEQEQINTQEGNRIDDNTDSNYGNNNNNNNNNDNNNNNNNNNNNDNNNNDNNNNNNDNNNDNNNNDNSDNNTGGNDNDNGNNTDNSDNNDGPVEETPGSSDSGSNADHSSNLEDQNLE